MDVGAIGSGKSAGGSPPCTICGRKGHTPAACWFRPGGPGAGKGKTDSKVKGKGDVKGAKGNWKGKSGGKQPSGKGSGHFDGECSYCHKWGHKRADCRKRIADEKGYGLCGGRLKSGVQIDIGTFSISGWDRSAQTRADDQLAERFCVDLAH